MDPKGADLANRLKVAIESGGAARPAQAREDAPGADAALAALMDELVAFAAATGHIEAECGPDELVLRYGARGLRFQRAGDGLEVFLLGWPNTGVHRIEREPQLQHRWVLQFRKAGRDERMPLFDRGLEELMVEGLGIPRPAPVDRPISARTAAALSGRAPDDQAEVGERERVQPDPERPKKRTL